MNMTTDDVLSKFGLQTRTSASDMLLPALGIFGAGAVVGAGVALLLAPKSGAELRNDIGLGASRLKSRVMPNGRGSNNDLADLSRDELYERAREMDVDGRSDMSKAELLEAVRAS